MVRDGARRVIAATVVVGLLACTAPAALATPQDVGDARAELDRTEEELAAATADLEALGARIDEVEAEVAAADQQLGAVSSQLVLVEQRLVAAEALVASTERTLDEARARLAHADDGLDRADERFRSARSSLDDRAALVWMRGPGREVELVLGGLGSARDLHDVAVLAHAARTQLDTDRRLLDEATASAAAMAVARAGLADERAELTIATVAAYAARDDADDLVAQQRLLVAEAADHQRSRRAALARIEQDAAARAALVDRLEDQVRELRAAALDDWLRDVGDLPFDGPPPAWAPAMPAAGRPVAPAIVAAAAAVGIDARLLAALVWTESAFNPRAVSPAGAIGLAQLMPGTAAGLGVDPWDPSANLLGGARYLRTQLDRFGRIDLALAAYNAGPGRVLDAGGAVPDIVETQLYVLRVLDRWEQLR